MRRPKQILFYGILFLSIIAFLETASFFLGRYFQKKGIFYAPHVTETYRQYRARMDPTLGWPSRSSYGQGDLDKSGSRIIPSFPDPDKHQACVSIYGDSFAWGSEVDNEHALGNQLALLLGCRVANYGIPAYGTDQAYLRYHTNRQDQARIVILGHMSEDITRNVGQFRNLAVPTSQFLLKPRFWLDASGHLHLAPVPPLTAKNYDDFNKHPEKYLRHEFFLPGGASGIQRFTFPYTLSILRLYKRFYIKEKLKGEPRYIGFYQPGHPAKGLQITAAICNKFYDEALSRGQVPIIVFFPTGPDLLYYLKSRKWSYAPLMERLRAKHVDFLNIGPGLMDYLGNRNPCKLFKKCDTHYNEEGNRAVAQVIFAYLKTRHLTPQTAP